MITIRRERHACIKGDKQCKNYAKHALDSLRIRFSNLSQFLSKGSAVKVLIRNNVEGCGALDTTNTRPGRLLKGTEMFGNGGYEF